MTALSAPDSVRGENIVSIAILVVSILSALGAAWMILSFTLIPSLRTFRHQLTLGLGISDFAMALNFMLSACMNLSGRKIWTEPQKGFCSFNGFMTQVFVIQTDYWVLNIAICTYSILANHKRLYGWLQDHPLFVCLWPWVLSIIWAILGLVLAGYQNIGGFCWFASDRTRLLVNFIPRWIIIFIIIALYLRLTYILLRIQKQLESTEEDTTIILSGHHNMSRQIDLQQKDPQTNSYPHTSDSRSATANVQRSGPTSKLKKVAVRMMMYPVLYMLIWTIPTAIRIYQGTSGHSTPLGINCVDKGCIVIQGLADSIIYGLNERTWNEWMKWIFPRRSRINS